MASTFALSYVQSAEIVFGNNWSCILASFTLAFLVLLWRRRLLSSSRDHARDAADPNIATLLSLLFEPAIDGDMDESGPSLGEMYIHGNGW